MTTPVEILERIRNIKSDTAGVMEVSRWVEWVLANRFGAEGTGIHSRVTSVEHRLPGDLVSDLRYLGSVRNDFAHNPLAEVRSPERYTRTSHAVLRRLLETSQTAAKPVSESQTAAAGRAAAPSGRRSRGFVALAAGACLSLVVLTQWPRLLAAVNDLPGPSEAEQVQDAEPAVRVEAPRVEPPAPARQAHAARTPKPVAQPRVEAQAQPASSPVTELELGDSEVTLEQLRALKGRL